MTTIGSGAFSACNKLGSLDVASNNSYYCSENGILFTKDKKTLLQYPAGITQTVYTIPNSVTTIGEYAFRDCDNLISVTIGDNVTTIGYSAFHECTNMSEVHITDLMAWCNVAFSNSYANPLYCASDLYLNEGKVTDFVIPDGVTMIGDMVFYGCDSLTSVAIGNSVTTIGEYAFSKCSGLDSVEIGGSVTTIGERAFYDCDSMASVTIGDSVTTIGDDAFQSCDSLISVILGDGVEIVGEYAFADCTSLTSVDIPDSVTTIGSWAFSKCYGLTSVTIGDNMETIGGAAFYGCGSLISVDIPDSVTDLGDSAFYDCANLTSVTIGDGVTTIRGGTFFRCYSLSSVTIGDGVTAIEEYAFDYCKSLTIVHYYGTWRQWEEIIIGDLNGGINSVPRHYMSLEYTPNEVGTHTVRGTCPDCDMVAVKTVVGDCVDENRDDFCDLCGEEMSEDVEYIEVVPFKVSTIPNLGTELGLSMLFPKSAIREDLTYTATVTQLSNGEEVGEPFVFTEEDWSERTVSGVDYWSVSVEMPAKCMADEFVLEIEDQDGNVWNLDYSMSYRTYGDLMLARTTDTKMKTLLVDMLNYGAAAQEKFGYNEDDLANSNIDAYQKCSLGSVSFAKKFVTAANYKGVSASLESKILLNMFFKFASSLDVSKMYAMVKYTDYNGKAVSYKVNGTDFVSTSGGYGVAVPTVPADVNTAIKVTIYHANGKVYDTMTESVGSYLTRASAVLKNDPIFTKVGLFGQAAYNYLSK